MNEVIINAKKGSTLKLLLMGTSMVALCMFLLYIGLVIETNFLLIIIGSIGTLFFGAAYIFIIFSAINKKPLVTINDYGVIDTSTAAGVGLIKWEDINEFRLVMQASNVYIAVDVKELDTYLNNISPLKRHLINLNIKLKFPPIMICITNAEKSTQEIIKLLVYYQDLKQLN